MKKLKLRKIYIFLHYKWCSLLQKNVLTEYITVFKYRNNVGYFINVPAFNKKDAIRKVREIVKYSDFFYGQKINKLNEIQVIVIKRNDNIE